MWDIGHIGNAQSDSNRNKTDNPLKIDSMNTLNKVVNLNPVNIVIEENFNLRSDYGDLETLANSILESGLQTPLIVRNHATETNKFILVSGHRRMRAINSLIEAGHEVKEIPALIEKKGLSDENRIVDMLLLNDGKAFTPLEEAQVFQKLVNLGWSQGDIAKKTGRKQGNVSNLLNIFNLPMEVQKAIENGSINAYQALNTARELGNDNDKIKEVIAKSIELAQSEGKGKATAKQIDRVIKEANSEAITENPTAPVENAGNSESVTVIEETVDGTVVNAETVDVAPVASAVPTVATTTATASEKTRIVTPKSIFNREDMIALLDRTVKGYREANDIGDLQPFMNELCIMADNLRTMK